MLHGPRNFTEDSCLQNEPQIASWRPKPTRLDYLVMDSTGTEVLITDSINIDLVLVSLSMLLKFAVVGQVVLLFANFIVVL